MLRVPDNMEDKHDNTANFLDSKLLYPEVLEESDLLLMLKEVDPILLLKLESTRL